MSVPSEGVRVLQESPATLPLSPIVSPGPQWPRGAREHEGRGREVWGLSSAPWRGVKEGRAAEGEAGRAGSRSGGWRGSEHSQHRMHARRDLRHAEGSAQIFTSIHNYLNTGTEKKWNCDDIWLDCNWSCDKVQHGGQHKNPEVSKMQNLHKQHVFSSNLWTKINYWQRITIFYLEAQINRKQ